MNRLYFGDCLDIMQEMPAASVDLIYLDPPFNSNRDYNMIYQDETGRPLPDQVRGFSDLWALDNERERAIKDLPVKMCEAGVDAAAAEFLKTWMDSLRTLQPQLLAYLSYMAERLLPMRTLLKPTGSIYLHCDPTASHYLKLVMDGIFGIKNFQNEIVWCYREAINSRKRWNRKHDTLLFYSNSKKWTFNADDVLDPHAKSTIRKYKYRDERGPYRLMGRGITDSPVKSKRDVAEKWEKERPDLVYRHYLREGTYAVDYWMIDIINQNAKERLGYATQKPLALLERIIKASSNPNDVVFDPFCGCATTLEAAHHLKRRWIGIDITIHAIKRVAKVRLEERLGLREDHDFTVTGLPRTLEGARDLWERDTYQFQRWVVEQVDGFVTTRQTADGGIDGRLYFDMGGDSLQSMVLEVKGGTQVGIGAVRDLRGALERDDALMAGLVVMDDPGPRKTANFQREMAAAGDLNHRGVRYARMQLLTVADILLGKRFNTPSVAYGKSTHTTIPLL